MCENATKIYQNDQSDDNNSERSSRSPCSDDDDDSIDDELHQDDGTERHLVKQKQTITSSTNGCNCTDFVYRLALCPIICSNRSISIARFSVCVFTICCFFALVFSIKLEKKNHEIKN